MHLLELVHIKPYTSYDPLLNTPDKSFLIDALSPGDIHNPHTPAHLLNSLPIDNVVRISRVRTRKQHAVYRGDHLIDALKHGDTVPTAVPAAIISSLHAANAHPKPTTTKHLATPQSDPPIPDNPYSPALRISTDAGCSVHCSDEAIRIAGSSRELGAPKLPERRDRQIQARSGGGVCPTSRATDLDPAGVETGDIFGVEAVAEVHEEL